ncbi:TPA: helix-turn-helix transcriptional regulator [Staphylococcus aureus]|uniref:helix-turn-helix transcriptional regulator n=1 Tax=Staphylococcus aureus TaxID=1280 RepID=UPI000768F5A0|nr:helix-turn-helix transcriptional regulator [Staphylococcus aureus]WQC07596.1 helix-turn-helix transcriptional regulator [Staphylococcus aureus]CAC8266940.1 phage regulatory protein [Staphylococcus aureus]CXH49732.1 phage regulatory protein [Staphylococcus aureus]CXS57777.1 phage regulatory protein [Staphylococcus aureus]CXS59564.1 phage regulatory protein [Staphylococcus aureus]
MNENVKLLLRAARINNGMSQKKAASLLGVHYQTLASWEKDSSDLSRSKMLLMEKIYSIPLEYIFLVMKTSLFVQRGGVK